VQDVRLVPAQRVAPYAPHLEQREVQVARSAAFCVTVASQTCVVRQPCTGRATHSTTPARAVATPWLRAHLQIESKRAGRGAPQDALHPALAAVLAWAIACTGWSLCYGAWYGRPRIDGRPG
jgi:hypothetical protein